MESVRALLDVFSGFVTVVGLPIGLYSIYLNQKAAQNSVDTQIVATLSLRFQERWEKEWRSLLRKNENIEHMNADERDNFFNLLNWIDWLGILMQEKAFSRPGLMLRSIESPLKKAIFLSKNYLNESGPDEWRGVFQVADWLDIVRNRKIEVDLKL